MLLAGGEFVTKGKAMSGKDEKIRIIPFIERVILFLHRVGTVHGVVVGTFPQQFPQRPGGGDLRRQQRVEMFENRLRIHHRAGTAEFLLHPLE